MQGVLRYLAETGRNQSGRRIALPAQDKPVTGARRNDGAGGRRLREKLLGALTRDRLVLSDASFTAGVEAALGGRVRTTDLVRIARVVAASFSEPTSVEALSPSNFSATLALGESPLARLERLAAAVPELLFEATLDGTTGLGSRPVAESVLREAALELGRAGVGLIRVREAANRVDRLQAALGAAARTDALVEAVFVLTGDVQGNRLEPTVELLKKLATMGAALVGLEDPRGALRPTSAYGLVRTLRRELPAIPVRLRLVDSVGHGTATAIAAAEAGVGAVSVVHQPLGRGHVPPQASAIAYALGGTERAPAILDAGLAAIATSWNETLEALAAWRVTPAEAGLAPIELTVRESIPPRAATDLESVVQNRGDGEALRDAILEAHDPVSFQERRQSLELYGPLSQLPTGLFLQGLQPGEEAIVALPNGGGEHRVLLRSLDGGRASFVVDGADMQISLE